MKKNIGIYRKYKNSGSPAIAHAWFLWENTEMGDFDL